MTTFKKEAVFKGIKYILTNVFRIGNFHVFIIMQILEVAYHSVIKPFLEAEKRASLDTSRRIKRKKAWKNIKDMTHKKPLIEQTKDFFKIIGNKHENA